MRSFLLRAPSKTLLGFATLLLLSACGGGAAIPSPRPLVIFSGVRIAPEPERMQEIDGWFRPQMSNIEDDPSFLIVTVAQDSAVLPWETLSIDGDTARINFQSTAPDAQTPYMIYAHLHLMKEMDRLERWLPDAADETGFALEKAILERVADVWLYGRSIFDAAPHGPLDELMYAREFDFLDAMILTAREEEFPEERERWLAEDPDGIERYRNWFEDTFGRQPPGLRTAMR